MKKVKTKLKIQHIPNQQKVWNNIAEEWYEFKQDSDPETLKFIKSCKGKILDLGCATGRHFIKQTGKNLIFYAVDFSPKMIQFAKKKAKKLNIKKENIYFFVEEATKLPFKNNFFDCAIAIAVLHCIKGKANRKKTLKELFRVLKPNTKARISVWNKESKRFKNASKEKIIKWRNKGERYYYLYNEKELVNEVKNIGFKIKSIKTGINISLIVQKPK